MPRAYVETSENGRFLIKMLPNRFSKSSPPKPSVGIAYRLEHDGRLTELWRIEDSYSSEVYLSNNGQYLVSMGPWSVGHEPEDADLAVSFYNKGKLLRKYSTAELVKDRSTVLTSVSHYMWLARDGMNCQFNQDRSLEATLRIDWENVFHLKSIDGIKYEFDVSTGTIKKKTQQDSLSRKECER